MSQLRLFWPVRRTGRLDRMIRKLESHRDRAEIVATKMEEQIEFLQAQLVEAKEVRDAADAAVRLLQVQRDAERELMLDAAVGLLSDDTRRMAHV